MAKKRSYRGTRKSAARPAGRKRVYTKRGKSARGRTTSRASGRGERTIKLVIEQVPAMGLDVAATGGRVVQKRLARF